MNCLKIKRLLHIYVDNACDSELKTQIKSHIDTCDNCRTEFNSLSNFLEILSDIPVPQKTDDYWNQMHDSILHSIRKSDFSKKIFHFPVRKALLAAAVTALCIISIPMFLKLYFVKNSTVTVATVENFEGSKISVLSPTASKYVKLDKNRRLPDGTSLETGEGSSIGINIDKKTTLILKENGKLTINKVDRQSQLFFLKSGDLLARVSKRTHEQLFRIHTPNAFCEIIGTRFLISYKPNENPDLCRTKLSVIEGKVKFGTGDEVVYVNENDSSVIEGSHIVNKDNKKSENPEIKVSKRKLLHETHCTHIIPKKNEPSQSMESDEFKNLFQKAVDLIDSGFHDSALVILKRLYDNPSVPNQLQAAALIKAAVCLKLDRNYSSALSVYDRIINGPYPKEKKESAIFETALIKTNLLHDFEGAESALAKYISEFPDGVWAEDAYMNLAELFLLDKKYSKAADIYEKFVNKYTGNFQREKAVFELAGIYSRDLKDYDKADRYFTELMSKYPESRFFDDALFWDADCLYRKGRISQSIKEFKEYLTKFPQGKWASEVAIRLNANETAEISK